MNQPAGKWKPCGRRGERANFYSNKDKVGNRKARDRVGICLGILVLGWGIFSCSRCDRPAAPPEAAEEKEKFFTRVEQGFILNLARETLSAYLFDNSLPRPDESELTERLRERRACFVTLNHKDSGLRGCMGHIFPSGPLYRCVIDRAVAAATQDPRFPRVRVEELREIEIEVSVLSRPREMDFSGPADLLEKLRPRIDGVVLRTRYGGATFLPQVWEDLPQPERFLSRLCRKHGAPYSCWREEGVKVSTYQASVFKEAIPGRIVVREPGAVAGPGGAIIIGKIDDPESAFIKEGERLEPGTKIPAGSVIGPESDFYPSTRQ